MLKKLMGIFIYQEELKISDNGIKRLIFDFPNILYVDKGLSVNEDGEILFIGSAGEDKKEYIYKYSDGTVTLVDEDIDTCNFININQIRIQKYF